MRIGILTFHRACNHGAVLQCLALQRTLTDMGHDARVIDYRQEYIERLYSPYSIRKLPGFNRLSISYLKGIPGRIRILTRFRRFIKRHLSIIPLKSNQIPDDLDAYVIGSDQVWSKNCTGEIDKVYFGEFDRKSGSRLIGYGISGPVELVKDINPDWLTERVGDFDSISFRESENTRHISELTSREDVETVLDPTLLQSRKFYEELADKDVPETIVVLLFRFRMSEEYYHDTMRHVKNLSHQTGYRIKILSKFKGSPAMYLSWIKNAKMVVTNSFHATVFSLIFNKPITTVFSGDNLDARYLNLLKSVGAVGPKNPEPGYIDLHPDYEEVNGRLSQLRIESLKFLEKDLT